MSQAPDMRSSAFINRMGYFPVTGQVVGACRILCGALKCALCALVTLGFFLFKSSSKAGSWLKASYNGLKHMGRGSVELVPLFGGCATWCYDSKKERDKIERDALLARA